jgi:Uma2 family endonuclease
MTTEKHRFTQEDYEKLPEGTPYQLIGGEFVMTPSPNAYHQKVSRRIFSELLRFVESGMMGEVFYGPLDVYFAHDEIYQPDIIYIAHANKSIIREKIHGAPDLIIEILSESSAYHDLKHKKDVYEAMGVKEYWIVDPMEKSIEVCENNGKLFQLVAKVKNSGPIRSKLLEGFGIIAENIF